MAYTEVTVAGYNASPPPDDGSSSASNQVSWAGIKTKLADPIYDALLSIDDNIATMDSGLEADIASLEADVASKIATSTATTNLYAPSGTLMVFQQTAAPTGWTKETTHDNKAFRVVSGTASTGGSTSFTAVFASDRTLTEAQLPSHDHGNGTLALAHTHPQGHGIAANVSYTVGETTSTLVHSGASSTQAASSSAVTGSTANAGSGADIDFGVAYVDLIIASRDA